MFEYFIYCYGTQILTAILCAIFGCLGYAIKRLATKYINDDTKRTIAKVAVQFVEQVWTSLHGADKLAKALETTGAGSLIADAIVGALGSNPNPMILLLVIFIVAYPFLWMVFTAFKPYRETITYPPTLLPTTWSLEGLTSCLAELDVHHFMKNSLVVSISVLILQYIVIIPAAYAFARVRFPGRSLLFGIVLLGFMIPQQVTFVPVYLIFSKAKALQSYWPQILPFVANAFGIFLLRQYFMQIPEEIISYDLKVNYICPSCRSKAEKE